MSMPADRQFRNILFIAVLLAASAGAQESDSAAVVGTIETTSDEAIVEETVTDEVVFEEGESLDIPDLPVPPVDDPVFEPATIEDETLADEPFDDPAMRGPSDQPVPFADDAADTGIPENQVYGPEEPPALTELELLNQEFQRYKTLMENRIFDEADVAAKRVVELALKVTGPTSLETARALTNLAVTQHANKQYDTAQQNYLAAIGIIEQTDNRLSEHLVNPLKGLAAAQLEGGQPELSRVTYNRGVHITHVNEGPHNLEQLELLQALAEVNLRLGNTKEARELQDRMYWLNVRQYSGDSMGLVPMLAQRAQWQHRAGLILDERATYRRIIQIIEKAEGKTSLSLLTPLILYGKSFLYANVSSMSDIQQTGLSTGEIFFKRAVRIAEKNPETSWKDRAITSLALGDYYMFISNEKRGQRVYRETWEMLSGSEEELEFRRRMLEQPVLLREWPLPQYLQDPSDESRGAVAEELQTATLVLAFEISEDGLVTELKLVEAEPAEFIDMQRTVIRNFRARTYRPRYVDGKPVPSPDHSFVHTYYYHQSDLDALRRGVEHKNEEEVADSDAG